MSDETKQLNHLGQLRIAAPKLPPAHAETAMPMTGAGHHRAGKVAQEDTKNEPAENKNERPRSDIPAQPVKRAVPPPSAAVAPRPPVTPPPLQATTPEPQPLTPPLVAVDSAMQSLMLQALGQQKMGSQKFYLLTVADNTQPEVQEYDTVQSCIEAIKEIIQQVEDKEIEPCSVFPFLGQQLKITAGPNRFLVTPMGSLPLFDMPDPDSLDSQENHGWIGPEFTEPDSDIQTEDSGGDITA